MLTTLGSLTALYALVLVPPLLGAQELDLENRTSRANALEELVRGARDLTDEESKEAVVQTVMAALADPDPFVADTGQLLIPKLQEAGIMEALFDKQGLRSKDEAIQLRAAEAIGRLEGPVDAQRVLRHLSPRNVPLSRMLIWSLERLADNDALSGKPERTIKSVRNLTGRGDKDEIRAAAVQTLSILDSWDGAIAMDNLRVGCGVETAAALMDVIERLKPTGYQGALRRGLEHESAAARMRAIDMLLRGGIGREDLDAIIARLDDEPRAAIRSRIREALRFFTGLKDGVETKEWREHAKGLTTGWTSEDTTNAFKKVPNRTGSIERIDELHPSSDRVAILLDVSASYWRDLPSGRNMAKEIRPEIVRLLKRLEQTGSFLLIPFADKPLPFSRKMLKRSAQNIERVDTYLAETLPGAVDRSAPSNIAAAIDYALGDDEVDRIVVLSASSHYVGSHANVELMARLYAERTRFRPAIFDFVLLNVKGAGPPRWYRLANPRGGQMFRLQVR